MLVDELGPAIPFQQQAEPVVALEGTLELDAVLEKDRELCPITTRIVQEGVLALCCFLYHAVLPLCPHLVRLKRPASSTVRRARVVSIMP